MPKIMDLAGEWKVALDRENIGIREQWYTKTFEDAIPLPGTTDEAGLGDVTEEACADRLSRVRRWIGPAWYQKTVTIPKGWRDKKVFLLLERTKDSQVWVDDTWAGSDDSLSTPHEFDLSKLLTPGKHTLTILIDNAKLPPVGPCHQVDERTQTNWNGIVGRMELRATEPIWIRDLQATPSPETRSIALAADVVNDTSWSGAAELTWRAEVVGREKEFAIPPVTTGKLLNHGPVTLRATMQVPENVPCWDEFDPDLLRVVLTVRAMPVSKWITDSRTVICGLRSFAAARGQFVVNGRLTFLRGKVDSALFPLTGYAPMDKEEWLRLLSIAKDYGINHYRFHSWCPPEAAFAAADELGIYLQAELPNKREIAAPDNRDYRPPAEAYETLAELEGDGGPPAIRTAYLTREGERILRCYGNHPSFVMLTLGNELGGDESVMRGMLDHFRAIDRRHLYAMGTGHFHWDIGYREGDEFWVTRATGQGLPMRGASFEVKCHVDHVPPSTTVDYSASLHGVPVPVVGHETASYEVYPDYSEIRKYKGVLRARNFEIFRERLRDAGMLDQARDFFRASGALSTICHREEVEAALRTPGSGGFQMLDIQDFTGQGTALVGILNVFMESKGLIRPEEWREFCCETVPLLWMTKYTWTNDEVFLGRIRLAHYGPRDLEQQTLTWQIKDGRRTLAKGQTRAMDIPTGTVTDVDLMQAPLGSITSARKLAVILNVKGTAHRNRYDLWVYPSRVDTAPPKGVTVARTFSRKVQQALAKGGSVLLLPRPGAVRRTVAMAFQTGFWSPMFRLGGRTGPDGREVPGTQGILCDPGHALFRDFPTEFHSNWQWWQLVKHSAPMILDDTDKAFRPIVQVIDGIDRNHRLGLILEAKVGGGRLLVCSIDLPGLQEHPEARQLLASVHGYMASRHFAPQHELSVGEIKDIV